MARRNMGRLERNVNRAERVFKGVGQIKRTIRNNVRGIRRRLKQPGSGLGQYTGWW